MSLVYIKVDKLSIQFTISPIQTKTVPLRRRPPRNIVAEFSDADYIIGIKNKRGNIFG